jgi:predicted esterase
MPSPSGAPGAGSSGSTSAIGPSPGPAILYAPAATPPQLSNTGIWNATPILISGASAYRSGEYLYQDFLYDDHGANGTAPDANQTGEVVAGALSRFTGTYTYPTAASYAGNAADLVEFRMKPTADATAFRITLNTMVDPTVYACTIALGTSGAAIAIPHGANAREPAQMFVTVHGSTGDIIDAATGQVVGTPTVTVDQTRRQVTVLVPYSVYDTRGNTALRVAAAVGLWNASTGAYLLPSVASSATVGGGAGTLVSPPAFYNVAFRHAEPALGASLTDEAANMTSFWRDYAQATALATGDLSSFYDTVDMTKLAAGTTDDMTGTPQGVPTSGHIDRILPSHYEPFQGRSFTGCVGDTTYCSPEYGNALQPYAVYVPANPPPARGYPLTPLLHSLAVNYNQFANTNNESQFASRDGGSLVFTTEGRGPDNWYYGLALADVFEVWADVARNYPIDENDVALTGYSMGGYATFKLGVLYPDLFGSMQPTVGPTFVGAATNDNGSTDTKQMFASLRNIPILSWHASADELVPTPFALEEEQTLASDNLDFEWDLFAPAEHLTLTLNDEYAPAEAFIAKTASDPNPAHVTFVRNPSMDAANYGVVNDHAYWVSGIVERDTADVTGTIDILSHGFGTGDPPTSGAQAVAGTLTGGSVAAIAYTGFKNTYGTPPSAPVADELTVTATNISAATITPGRARVDCNVALDVTTDGALTLTLAGCPGGVQSFAKGRTVRNPRREGTNPHPSTRLGSFR